MNSHRGPHPLLRLLKIALIAELAYLLLFNTLLYVPLTQTVVNLIRPEKFQVRWESAWTWYPFRVHARGISANGQSRTQQWQLETPAASGSISLLPLVLKRVRVSNVAAADISYKQRPRLRSDRNYDDALPFFPAIEGRAVLPAETRPLKQKRPWKIAVNGLRASGEHIFWIYQFQGRGLGDFEGDLTYETRGGPFSLDGRRVDLELDPLHINGDTEVFRQSSIRGRLGFAPFRPRENKGISLLQYLWFDADIDVDLDSLAFINLFTANFGDLRIDGRGKANGLLNFDRGRVLEGTSLSVTSNQLSLQLLGLAVEGDGNLALSTQSGRDDPLLLTVDYRDLQVTHPGDGAPLLTGRDLGLAFSGDDYVLPESDAAELRHTVGFTIDGLAVPDLARLQRYLPPKWPFELHGGSGELRGSARLTPTSAAVDLRLDSSRAALGVRQYHFVTNLEAALVLDNPSVLTGPTALSGSYVKLGDAKLASDTRSDSRAWQASLEITDGYLSVLEESRGEADHVTDLLQILGHQQSHELLGNSRGAVNFTAEVSSLAWIAVLLGENYHTGVAGKGTIAGELHLAGGLPAPGTDIDISSPDLQVNFLDYRSYGDGAISLQVKQGGTAPDWQLGIVLEDADLRRKGDSASSIHNVDLDLQALIEDVSFDRTKNDFALQFRMSSATVADMSVFNRYLPPDAPLQIEQGAADLAAELVMQPDDADGWLTLRAPQFEAQIDGQSVSGDLSADIRVGGGKPKNMLFDISGSELRLDNVRVSGDRETFQEGDWSAVFRLLQADATWSQPPRIYADAELTVSDSRPVVALFNNQGYRPDWLKELATLEDIQGNATVAMADNTIVIPMARAVSDKAEIRAKGVIGGNSRDGMIYARYKKLDALVKFSGGRKNLDIIKVRETFDAYKPRP